MWRFVTGQRAATDEVLPGVGRCEPRGADDLAERRDAWVAFHTAHGNMDAHGLTPQGAAQGIGLPQPARPPGHVLDGLPVLADADVARINKRYKLLAMMERATALAVTHGPGDGLSAEQASALRKTWQGAP
jgi:hypothetical protein